MGAATMDHGVMVTEEVSFGMRESRKEDVEREKCHLI